MNAAHKISGKQAQSGIPVKRIILERPETGGPSAPRRRTGEGRRYAYLWSLAPRRREGETWRGPR